MTPREPYTVQQTAQMLSLSKAALRSYASKDLYRRYLSTEATPEPGKERRFTSDDVKLFAFIVTHTKLGESHEQVAQRLAAKELKDFDWNPTEQTTPLEQSESQQAALVPVERLQAAHALLADARLREESVTDQLREAQDKIERLTLELGQAQGERDALRRRRPGWWVRLFGE